MLTFTVYRGDQIVQELDLEGDEITIGRNVSNQIVLPDEGKGISRDHATLRNEGGRYVLYDRNSKIGTVVDGKKIKRVVLEPGQEFVIGPYRLVFNIADPSSAGLRPTMALPLPPPPPAEVSREGTERRTASQTHSKQPTVRSAAPGAKVTDAMAWVTRQPPSVLYTAGVVLVAFGAFLLWRLWLWPPAPPLQVTVASTTTTTTSIEPEVPITADEIAAVRAALDEVDLMITPADSRQRLDASRYATAVAAYEQILNERIQPLLNKKADHPQVRELFDRAQTGAATARDIAAKLTSPTQKPVTTTVPPAISDPHGVQRRADESDAAYDDRNSRAKADRDRALALQAMGDLLGALKALIALGNREPSLFEINAHINNAQAALQKARQAAVAEAHQRNEVGYNAAVKQQFAVAVPALTEAWKALNRAVALDDPSVSELVKQNEETRVFAAQEIIKRAQSYAVSERFLKEAKAHFQWVIELLPPSHPLWKDAETSLKKLGS